jgi:DNA-binding transcriptional MerR regulator/effector-binding domain-containing protein
MLRHYDATGLLRPARVDPSSGYRFYAAGQLAPLNRIIALKDLGSTLDQVRAMLDQQVSAEQLHWMLRLRRAELQSRIAAGTSRLAQVEARLPIIEMEGHRASRRHPGQADPGSTRRGTHRDRGRPGACRDQPDHPAVVSRAGPSARRRRLIPVGPAIAYYQDAPDGGGVIVHAALPVNADPGAGRGFEITDLAEISQAATIVDRGSMDDVMATFQALARWIEDNGYRSAGYARELYLECPPDDQDKWVTELQEPITSS